MSVLLIDLGSVQWIRSTRNAVNVEMSAEMNGKQLDTTQSVNGRHNGPVSITVQLYRDDSLLSSLIQFRRRNASKSWANTLVEGQ